MISDLDEPDLAVVAISVAARQFETLGGSADAPAAEPLTRTCHFSSVTAAVWKLK